MELVDFKQIDLIQNLYHQEKFIELLDFLESETLDFELQTLIPKPIHDPADITHAKNLLISEIQVKLGNYLETNSILQEIETSGILEQHPDAKMRFDLIKAEMLFKMGEHQDTLTEVDKALKFLSDSNRHSFSSHECEIYSSKLFNLKGNVFWSTGEIDFAIGQYKESLRLKRKINDESGIAAALHNLGLSYRQKGEFNRALEYYDEALKVFSKLGKMQTVGSILNNVGVIYRMQGHLDHSLSYFERSFEIFEKIKKQDSMASRLENMGVVYFKKNNLDKAYETFLKALNIMNLVGNDINVSQTLFYILQVTIEKGDLKSTSKYQQRLEDLAVKNNSDLIHLRAKLSKAIFLKSTNRLKNIVEAHESIKEILDSHIRNYEIRNLSIINLCEIYFIELQVAEDENLVTEISGYINELLDSAVSENSNSLHVESLILRSKLELIRSDVDKTIDTLSEALKLSQRYNLISLGSKIIKEIDIIKTQVEGFRSSYLRKSVQEKIEMLEIQDYLDALKKIIF